MEESLRKKIEQLGKRNEKLIKDIAEEIYYLVQLKKQIGLNRMVKAKIESKIRVLNSSLRLLSQNEITERDFENDKKRN